MTWRGNPPRRGGVIRIAGLLVAVAVTGLSACAAPGSSGAVGFAGRATLPAAGGTASRPAPSPRTPARAAGPAARPLVRAAAPVSANPPLARWPLDEASGRVAHDRAGRHPALMSGHVALGQVGLGPGDTSFGFDGSGALTAGAVSDVRGISAWVRTPGDAANRAGDVVAVGGVHLRLWRGHLGVLVCGSARRCVTAVIGPWVADGNWHQAALTVTGIRVTLSLDGAPVATGLAPVASGVRGTVRMGTGLTGGLDDIRLYRAPLDPGAVAAGFRLQACPQHPGATASAYRSLPALPLHAAGRFVVGATGARVKLAAVNWYGAEELDRVPAGLQCQTADAIAGQIAADGFTAVRLPWATDTWTGADPAVPAVAVAGDPRLRGLRAREAFDAVVAALAAHGLLVILDNHVTRPDWCCSSADGNGLWWTGYDPAHPPAWSRLGTAAQLAAYRAGLAQWLAAWRSIVGRYGPAGAHPTPAVVGADLRNEPRADAALGITPGWGPGSPAWADWPLAAEQAGDAVLATNPALLVIVEGLNSASDLRGAATAPVRLAVPNRLVYSVHEYPFFTTGPVGAAALRTQWGAEWGWLLTQNRSYTTPIWVGEFGVCHIGSAGCPARDAAWFAAFSGYLRAGDIDWAYWSVNGTGAHGADPPQSCAATLRFEGCPESYGLLTSHWAGDASPQVLAVLRSLAAAG